MRAPIGAKIRNRRKSLGLSQTGLAKAVGISPSYLNLIEANKRDVGGALLQRIAAGLELELGALTGEDEQRLLQELEEAFVDPIFHAFELGPDSARNIVAQMPDMARALAGLYRAYSDANINLEVQGARLQSDPLFSELLHQILSQITTVRSSSEILEDEGEISEEDSKRFLGSISRGARAMSDVAQTLIQHFDQSARQRRSLSPTRELDDLIIAENNYFPELEEVADALRAEVGTGGLVTEEPLARALSDSHGVTIVRGWQQKDAIERGAAQFHYDAESRTLKFLGSTTAATRKFQMARVFAELSAPDAINSHINDPRLSSPAARRLAHKAMSSYLAGALTLPYEPFLNDAQASNYDIDFLSQTYTASFEQVAHRLVTLRREGAEGIPFGFLRSDPAGRLTKHFPLPGLLLPNTGHACPLWAIYAAFRTPGQVVRQVARFADGSRYLFIAKTVSKRLGTFRDQSFHSSVMLACDILHADGTVYGTGLNLENATMDAPVGPACRLCVRRDCGHRQEEALGVEV